MHVCVRQHGQKGNWFSKCILLVVGTVVVGRVRKEEIEIAKEEERDRKKKELL